MASVGDQITEAQRECLRLVLQRYNSKEIAVRLGVSPSAVDKRIERAVQTLGVSSRFAAARRLAEEEMEGGMGDRLPWQSIDLPGMADEEQSGDADGPWGFVRRLVGMRPAGRKAGEPRVGLSATQRVGLLLALMLVVAVTSMALLNLGTTLSSLIRDHGIERPR